MLESDVKKLLIKISKLYYFEEWTQADIAKKIGVSRPMVSKMLQKAKEKGIVEIIIHDDMDSPIELEEKIESLFGLKDVLIIPTSNLTDDKVKSTVGKAAAQYVSRHIRQSKKIGISSGSSLYHLVKEYPIENRPDVKIIPLVGGTGTQKIELHSNQLAFELARKLNGTSESLYAPAIVETEELRLQLVQSPHIASVLEEGTQVDIAIVGIGTPLVKSTLTEIGFIKSEELDHLKSVGVVGDICSRLIKKGGQLANHPFNNKVIGIELEQLKKVDKVIGIGLGAHKADGILAALEGGYLDVLIMDDHTASELEKKLSRKD
jgi:DNA-binding transcriptional regulator LsrR (DeoR family)